jgi:hypothetical protein
MSNNILKEKASELYARKDYRRAFATYAQLDASGELTAEEFNAFLKSAKILYKPNAKELFERGIQLFPDFLHIKRNYIDFLIRDKNYEYAESLVNEILDYDERDPFAIDLQAVIFSRTNRLKLAIEQMWQKLNNPSVMNKTKGNELQHTFRTFFKILSEHLDITKSKSNIIELLLKEGKTMDNINLAFDEVQLENNFTTLKTKYKISPQLSDFLDTYSFVFWKLDKVFKLFKGKEFDEDEISSKEKLVHAANDFIKRAKTVIIKLSDSDKKAELILQYPRKSIFISYNRKDKDFAFKLHDKLKVANYDVRIDEFALEINDYLSGRLRELVRNSDYVISIVSRNSLLSEWVGLETIEVLFKNRFKDSKVKFISAVIDDKVFTNEIGLELILEIEEKNNKLLDLIMQVGKRLLKTELYDLNRSRLIDLAQNLDSILNRIREYLSVNFCEEANFDIKVQQLIKYIEEPKPVLAAA